MMANAHDGEPPELLVLADAAYAAAEIPDADFECLMRMEASICFPVGSETCVSRKSTLERDERVELHELGYINSGNPGQKLECRHLRFNRAKVGQGSEQ